jgi:hypothetical protein
MSKIFINYRREDRAPYAGRLYERLAAHFDEDQVCLWPGSSVRRPVSGMGTTSPTTQTDR